MLHHLAAEFIELESNRTSLITVTSCQLSRDSKYATILFTVLPDSEEGKAEEFLSRKRKDFKEFIMEKSRIGRIPEITFALDVGEKNRQRIEFLSQNN